MKRARTLIAGICLLLATSTLLSAAPASAVSSLDTKMLSATNSARLARGEHRLKLNVRMSARAFKHSEAMARAGTLFHTANVGTYLAGVPWHVWGENVGVTSGSISGLQRAFMHSTDHRRNILNRAFHHVAIGVYEHAGRLWVTVFFYG